MIQQWQYSAPTRPPKMWHGLISNLVWTGHYFSDTSSGLVIFFRDFGRSFALNRPVIDEILDRFHATLILSGTAFIICSVAGIAAGVISATRQYGWADKIITFSVLIGISVPSFFLGMMMILYFAVRLRWFPASGMYALYGGGDLADLFSHLVMPALALAAVATGVIARLSRAAMLRCCGSISSAPPELGAPERRVIFRHALRYAIVSIIPPRPAGRFCALGCGVYRDRFSMAGGGAYAGRRNPCP